MVFIFLVMLTLFLFGLIHALLGVWSAQSLEPQGPAPRWVTLAAGHGLGAWALIFGMSRCDLPTAFATLIGEGDGAAWLARIALVGSSLAVAWGSQRLMLKSGASTATIGQFFVTLSLVMALTLAMPSFLENTRDLSQCSLRNGACRVK